MIIEIENQLSSTKKLIASWLVNIAEEKESSTLDFIKKLMDTYKVKWELQSLSSHHSYYAELQSEKQYLFSIKGKPYNFYSIQNRMNEYLSVMNSEILIS